MLDGVARPNVPIPATPPNLSRVSTLSRATAALLVTFLPALTPLSGQTATRDSTSPSGTAAVVQRYGNRVVKIEVLEQGSAAKSTVGTGFFVSANGYIVTNYHVISSVVNTPASYHAVMIDRAGRTSPLRVLALDVINDVAIVGSDTRTPQHFDIGDRTSREAQGDRLFALGHPRDVGFAIVEGTYNGLLQHTLYPKLHFTGSLNPGMSGGPTIDATGHVVGINVSSAGEQLSFLVPVERARTLLTAVTAQGFAPPKDMLTEVARQLRENPARYTAGMFAPGSPTVRLGDFTLPTSPAPFFRCWGDGSTRRDLPYTRARHYCSTEDHVFITGDQSTGFVGIAHTWLASKELSSLRFYSLFEDVFRAKDETLWGSEEDLTRFACTTGNVREHQTTMRSVLCLRRYKRLPGLYDAVLKVAVLGASKSGVVTTMTLTGVTYESAQSLSHRYLERIAWRN